MELIVDDQKCRLRDIRFDLGRWSSSHEETEFRLEGMSPRLRAISLKIYCQFADAHKNNAFFKMSSLLSICPVYIAFKLACSFSIFSLAKTTKPDSPVYVKYCQHFVQ